MPIKTKLKNLDVSILNPQNILSKKKKTEKPPTNPKIPSLSTSGQHRRLKERPRSKQKASPDSKKRMRAARARFQRDPKRNARRKPRRHPKTSSRT